VLSSVLSYLMLAAKRGDEDASWLYRELSSRLSLAQLSYDGGDLGIGSLLFSSEEVGRHGS
jgi:hypothetical protein